MERNLSSFYSKRMEDQNTECLKHLEDDLTLLEYRMFMTLSDWYQAIRQNKAAHTVDFDFWCELVSRWEPMTWHWPECVDQAPSYEAGDTLRHVLELPDALTEDN